MLEIEEKIIGFDIVIGNPPYVQYPKGVFSINQFPYSEGKDKGKQNLYKVFVENSYNLLKNDGFGIMIVQSSLMCDISAQYTRELLLTKTKIKHFIEFPKKAKSKEGQVFDSVLQGTCIYSFNKSMPNESTNFNVSIDNDVTTISNMQFEKLNQFELMNIYPNGFFIPLITRNEFTLIRNIFSSSIILKEYFTESKKGDLSSDTNKNYFDNIERGFDLIRGNNVQKYSLKSPFNKVLIDEKTRAIVRKNTENDIIVFQNITGTTDKFRIHASLIPKDNSFIYLDTTIKIYLNDETNSKIILCQLNSKLIDWYFRKTSTNNHVNGYEIEQLPIKLPFSRNQLPFITITEKIIEGKKQNQDTSILEQKIDNLVYKLYDLSYLEVKVIDSTFSLTEQEYINIKLD